MKRVVNRYRGPGVGKTHECLARVRELVLTRNVPPQRVGYFAFTNRDADEARQRLMSGAQDQDEQTRLSEVRVETLHSAACRLLNRDLKRIILPYWMDRHLSYYRFYRAQSFVLTKGDLREHRELLGERELAAACHRAWSYARNFLAEEPSIERGYECVKVNAPHHLNYKREEITFAAFEGNVRAYDQSKRRSGYCDFDDLLLRALALDQVADLDYTFLDEVQDLTPLRLRFARERLEAGAEESIRVGDDDQTLYAFTGVRPELIAGLDGERDTTGNYSLRVPFAIWTEAERHLGRLGGRQPKEFLPALHPGRVYRDVENSKSLKNVLRFIRQREPYGPNPKIGVLFRNNKHLMRYSRQLLKTDVPFTGGHSPFSPFDPSAGTEEIPREERTGRKFDWRPHLPRMMSALFRGLFEGYLYPLSELLELLDFIAHHNPDWLVHQNTRSKLGELVRVEPHGLEPLGRIRRAHLDRLRKDPFCFLRPETKAKDKTYLDEDQADYLRGLYRAYGRQTFTTPSQVDLRTIHGSKGSQWDHVAIYNQASKGTSDRTAPKQEADSETRCKYVALTRAKHTVTVFGGKVPTYDPFVR